MKEFWRRVNQRQGKAPEGIPDPNSWPEHFASKEEGDLSKWCDEEFGNIWEEYNYPMREEDYSLTKEVDTEEVAHVLRKLKGETAPGIDGIPTRLYKKFSSLFMPIFILLFNSVLSSGIWVSEWKTSL